MESLPLSTVVKACTLLGVVSRSQAVHAKL